MRIGRLEFGLIHFVEGKPQFKLRYEFTHCLCCSFEFWRFYFTWLSDLCMPSRQSVTYGSVDLIDRSEGPAIIWTSKENPNMATKKKAAKKAPAKKKAAKKKSKK